MASKLIYTQSIVWWYIYGTLEAAASPYLQAQPGYSRGKLSVIKCDFGSSSTAGREGGEGGEGGARGVEPTQASFTPLAPR